MTKTQKLVYQRHKNVNLDDKKSQTRVKRTQKCKFR